MRILPDRVANQIAAGEVVERPSSVVKELLENALDAGATRIEVEFRHGGRSYIRVEDNGCGMSRDDALLSLERHATSKIREAADLERVTSFGFRGEALPSIASVSRFVLQTRDAASENGTEISVNGGRIVHVRDCGMPVGTRVVVSQLFNSVPARRKFLKSDATEAAHLVHGTRLYALGNPHVSFALVENGRTLFQSPVCATLAERVGEVFGRQIAGQLIPVAAREEGLELDGLISRPGVARATRHEMITFVNRRPVDSRTLAYALLESYQAIIPKGRYPLAFVFVGIDPAGVDVNVHPAKREVRFRDEVRVRGFTIRAVLDCLRREMQATAAAAAAACGRPADSGATMADVAARVGREGSTPIAKPVPAGAPTEEERRAIGAIEQAWRRPRTETSPAAPLAPAAGRPAQARVGWRHLGSMAGGFSLFENGGGLAILDRRAAAERVWYERLIGQYRTGHPGSQPLLFPVPLELDAIASEALTASLPFLREHGLAIEPFGRGFFRIEAVPTWLDPNDAEPFARDVAGLVRAGRISGRDLAHAREALARSAAARAAQAAARGLPADALDALVTDLLRCENPHADPAGRPTFIELGSGELARRFHRTPVNDPDGPELG